MRGYQITFYTQQDRVHEQQPLGQWLMEQAKQLGIRGATLTGATQGLGHDGRMHAITLFDLADQPLAITMAVTEDESARLFQHLEHSGVHMFYVKSEIEFGMIGQPHA